MTPKNGNKTCEEKEGMRRGECEQQLKIGEKKQRKGVGDTVGGHVDGRCKLL